MKILNSKLQIPRTTKMLFRQRLSCLLESVSEKKIALVIAGAGYGKTTLVAQAVKDKGLNTIWYYLDRSDSDFSVFMSYLIEGIKRYYPGFGEKPAGNIFSASSSKRSRKSFLLDFVCEIETFVSDDILIVFDDYHTVQENHEINETLEFVFERLPLNIHIIIIGRTEPPLRISRYRAMDEVVDIMEESLAFSVEEIGSLFFERFKIDIDPKKIETLYNKTGGWAAGLILFYNTIKSSKSGDTDLCLAGFEGSSRFIYQYFEENIFEGLDVEIQDFMVKTSLLSRLDTEFCDAYLNIDCSSGFLQELEQKNLFTYQYEDKGRCYYYHHLLKDFLIEKLFRDYSNDDIKKLHLRIANQLKDKNEVMEALSHLIEGHYYEEATGIISAFQFQDVVSVPLNLMKDYLNRIPAKFADNNPELLCVKAKFVSINGNAKEAISGFKLALKQFRAAGSEEGIAVCLKELGIHYYLTGNIQGAKVQLEELLAQERDDSFLTVELCVYMIIITSLQGKPDEADFYYAVSHLLESEFQSIEKKMVLGLNYLGYSFRFYITGDYEKSQDLNFRTLRIITECGLETFMPLTCYQCAAAYYYQGKYSTGAEYASKGISIAVKHSVFDHQYAWLLHARAYNNMGKLEYEKVTGDAEESLSVFRETDHYWGQASVYELFGRYYLKTGDINKAEKSIQKGLDIIKGLKLNLTEGMLLVCYIDIMIAKEEYAEAEKTISYALRKVSVSEYFTFIVHLQASRIMFVKEDNMKGMANLEKGLKIAEMRGYDNSLSEDYGWTVPHLVELYAGGVLKKYCKKLLSTMKDDIGCMLHEINRNRNPKFNKAVAVLVKSLPEVPSPALNICMFGKFRAYIGENEIPAEKWKNTKAAKLCKYLAYRRNQGFIPKEVLAELIWPEEDMQKTGKRLHVALSALRKIFEPDLKRGMKSSYIIKQKDSYRLDIQDDGIIDVEEFQKELDYAAGAEKKNKRDCLKHYLNAEFYYRGIFLEEDLYDDWCMAEKEMFNEKYLNVLINIMEYYEKEEDILKCIEYANKYINSDKYAENVYRSLMRFYFTIGENSRIVLTYEKCKENIEQNLNCPLSKETISLYNKLLEQSH